MHKWLLVGLLALAGAGAARTNQGALQSQPGQSQPGQGEADAPLLLRAQQLTLAFYAVDLEQVWASFTPELQAFWGGLDNFRAYRETGLQEYGPEAEVLDERVVRQGDLTYYVRAAVFARHPGETWLVVFGFDAGGRVAAFTITLAGDPGGPPTGEPLRTLLHTLVPNG